METTSNAGCELTCLELFTCDRITQDTMPGLNRAEVVNVFCFRVSWKTDMILLRSHCQWGEKTQYFFYHFPYRRFIICITAFAMPGFLQPRELKMWLIFYRKSVLCRFLQRPCYAKFKIIQNWLWEKKSESSTVELHLIFSTVSEVMERTRERESAGFTLNSTWWRISDRHVRIPFLIICSRRLSKR